MTSIDIPDFDTALRTSRDGSFQRAVLDFLDQSRAAVTGQLQRGLAPSDYANARKVLASIETATHVVRFSTSTR